LVCCRGVTAPTAATGSRDILLAKDICAVCFADITETDRAAAGFQDSEPQRRGGFVEIQMPDVHACRDGFDLAWGHSRIAEEWLPHTVLPVVRHADNRAFGSLDSDFDSRRAADKPGSSAS